MAGTTRWTAILGVRTRTPRSADSLRRNQLGIYIDAIDWTRELEPTETSPAPPAPAIISFGSPADPSPPAPTPSTREDPQFSFPSFANLHRPHHRSPVPSHQPHKTPN